MFQKQIHPSNRWLSIFLQIDPEVVRTVWHQVSSFGLAEHILEFVVSSTLAEKLEMDVGSVSEAEMVSVKAVEPGK